MAKAPKFIRVAGQIYKRASDDWMQEERLRASNPETPVRNIEVTIKVVGNWYDGFAAITETLDGHPATDYNYTPSTFKQEADSGWKALLLLAEQWKNRGFLE